MKRTVLMTPDVNHAGLRRERRCPMTRSAASASLLVALALVLVGSVAACRPRVPPPELAAQVATARTAEDHAALAAAITAKADEYAADAGAHRRLADAYSTEGTFLWYRHHDRSLLRLADHCNRAAENLAAAAAELRELARAHHEIAQTLGAEPEGTP